MGKCIYLNIYTPMPSIIPSLQALVCLIILLLGWGLGKGQCDTYLYQARQKVEQASYQKAINLLLYAQEVCPGNKSDEVNRLIQYAFQKIQAERDTAEARRIEAVESRKQTERLFRTFQLTSIGQRIGEEFPDIGLRLLELAHQSDSANVSVVEALYTQYRKDPGSKLFRLGHNWDVTEAVFSPDGNMVLTGSLDGKAMLWDAQTGQLIREFLGHKNHVNAVSFSPDGAEILTGSSDTTAMLWDTQSGAHLQTFSGHIREIKKVFFMPDERRILTVSGTGKALLWDRESGRQLESLANYNMSVSTAGLSTDGKYMVLGGSKKAVLWNVESGWPNQVYEGHSLFVNSVDISPDGKRLLTCSYRNTFEWDLLSGEKLKTLPLHKHDVQIIRYSPNGRYILTTSMGKVFIWDVETGEAKGEFHKHVGKINFMDFSPNGDQVLTASSESISPVLGP